jgi:hypothetical protein
MATYSVSEGSNGRIDVLLHQVSMSQIRRAQGLAINSFIAATDLTANDQFCISDWLVKSFGEYII